MDQSMTCDNQMMNTVPPSDGLLCLNTPNQTGYSGTVYTSQPLQPETSLNYNQSFPCGSMVDNSLPVQEHEPYFRRPVEVATERLRNHMRDISEVQVLCRELGSRFQPTLNGINQLRKCTGNIQVLDRCDVNQSENRTMQNLIRMRETLINNRKSLLNCHQERVFPRLKDLLSKIHHEIAEWQRAQAFMANGKYVESYDIVQLENCCKATVELMLLSLEQICNFTNLEMNSMDEKVLEQLRINYKNFIAEIVTFGLVVEKQPPQVLTKDKKFVCRLRHLVSTCLDLHKVNFPTEATLVSSDVACAIKENGPTLPIAKSGVITNSVKKQLDFSEDTTHVQVHMTNMMLKSIVRKSEADIVVTREKYCMVFRSQICLYLPHNIELNVTAQAMSLPIVVITHGKQQADAHATIFWDNAFSDQFRRPFEVPSQVQWSWILDGLHWLWKKECENESSVHMESGGLSLCAQKYLTRKLFDTESVKPNTMVTWNKFNQDNLPEKSFTFWVWFFKVMELVSSNHVKKYWNLGLIHGFVDKALCQEMLLQRKLGTFLFRFSDTILGGLSISYCDGPDHVVSHLEPDTIKDNFRDRTIPDTVRALGCIHYLYPDTPKDRAFGRHYTKPITFRGYKSKKLQLVVNASSQQHNQQQQEQQPQLQQQQFIVQTMTDLLQTNLPIVQSPGSSESSVYNVSRHESFEFSNQQPVLFPESEGTPFSDNAGVESDFIMDLP